MRESTERAFQAYGEPLVVVALFKYLGRFMTVGDDKWTVVLGNLRKYWKSWEYMVRILGQEGSDPRVSGMFFKSVVQAVFLFGSETWVLTPCMEQSLGSFQHRFARQITGEASKSTGGWGMVLPTNGDGNGGYRV